MDSRILSLFNDFINDTAKEYGIEIDEKALLQSMPPEYQEKYKEQIEWVNQELASLLLFSMLSKQAKIEEKLQSNQEHKHEIQSFRGSDWYEQFKTEHLDPALNKFANLKDVYDPNVRRMFLMHAQTILIHYGKEKSGSLSNYVEAVKLVNKEFDLKHPTTLGYVSLASTFPSIIKILFDVDVDLKGNLGTAIKIAKSKNLERKGRIPLLQVKCEAERDFALLVRYYLHALVGAQNRPIFDTKAFKLMIQSIKVVEGKLDSFLESLIKNYDKEILENRQLEVKITVSQETKNPTSQAVSTNDIKAIPEVKKAPLKFLGKTPPQETKNTYYDKYVVFSEQIKTFTRKPKVQRALFCACAALLNGIEGPKKNECLAYINQFTQSNNSTHKKLAVGLMTIIQDNQNKIDLPMKLLSETLSVKVMWNQAMKHKDFADFVNHEKSLLMNLTEPRPLGSVTGLYFA